MDRELLIPAVMVATATVFGVLALVLVWEVLRDSIRQAQARRRLRNITGAASDPAVNRALLRDGEEAEGLLSRLARGIPGVVPAKNLIRQARIDISVESYVLMTVAFAVALGGAALVLTGSVLAVVPSAALGSVVPYMWLSRRRALRERAFEESFPEAIDLLTRAIRAGHPISSGMRMVGDEGPAAVAEEFRVAFEEQRFGLPFEDALMNLVDRNEGVDVRIFVTALLVQRDVGGNLAEILDNLAKTIRARFYIRRQLRVYTAQGRMTGWVLGLLPVTVGGLIWMLEPGYMNILLEGLGGRAILVMAFVLQIVGVVWIRRVIAIEI